ncbi:hypothetical protein QUA54_33025 [Microcoleus sp. MOSTC5]|uniref:hypothetical protein n=1 Tax=Microcoleus sp. MOSTC5 TaxID=3055378 RepID=UPI002FD38818
MSFSGRLSSADSQTSAFSRRSMLGKLFTTAVATAAAKRSGESSTPKNYPLPKFQIGDLIASDWEDDEDEDAPDSATDFGEILGMRWLPERESVSDAKTWVYYVNWTHSTIGASSCYPCYDGEPSRECDLRLVS